MTALAMALEGLHVVALDYGVKKNILRCLVEAGCRVSVLPANSKADDVLALSPMAFFCPTDWAIRPRQVIMRSVKSKHW